jgi:hypothetical protein
MGAEVGTLSSGEAMDPSHEEPRDHLLEPMDDSHRDAVVWTDFIWTVLVRFARFT